MGRGGPSQAFGLVAAGVVALRVGKLWELPQPLGEDRLKSLPV